MLMKLRFGLTVFLIGLVVPRWATGLQGADQQVLHPVASPTLAHTCLITRDVKRLVDFYEPVLRLKAKWSGNDYAEFTTGSSVLAIFSFASQEKYIPGSSQAAANHSLVLEFEVADVDHEYQRLRGIVKTWVKSPTTQPWGTRSIYFRDADGNLVDFFSRAGIAPGNS